MFRVLMTVIARVRPLHLVHAEQRQAAVSLPVVCYRLHSPWPISLLNQKAKQSFFCIPRMVEV